MNKEIDSYRVTIEGMAQDCAVTCQMSWCESYKGYNQMGAVSSLMADTSTPAIHLLNWLIEELEEVHELGLNFTDEEKTSAIECVNMLSRAFELPSKKV